MVTEAADKGIPVQLDDEVHIYAKIGGTINNPDIKTDMNAVVDQAADDLKKEVDEFVTAKLDSAKRALRHPASTKKNLIVQTSHKTKSGTVTKKKTASSHKTAAHTNSKKKSKKKYYTKSVAKGKSVASSGKK